MRASNPTDSSPQCEPALRAIAMPADANPAGDIFGGWLLSQMDLAGSTVATRRASRARYRRRRDVVGYTIRETFME
jgi:acyl-CoA thioesterase YciA